MKVIFFTLLAFIAMLCACQETPDFKSLSVEEFAEQVALPNVQLLDVRTPSEYSEGHISGSLNINVLDENNFGPMVDEMLQNTHPVALYCRSGRRSKKAASILVRKGFEVIELDKGFNAWKEAGQTIEK